MDKSASTQTTKTMESKELLPQRQPPPPRRFSRTLLILLASLFALVVVGLAVGLGVGLTRHHNSTDAGSSASTTTSTMGATTSSTASATAAAGLWQPSVNASWQIVLSSALALDTTATTVTPDVDVWDIDMFSNTNTTISYLHSLNKHVICYFSAGSYEPGRPDSSQFLSSDKGAELDGWPGEYWLNLSSSNVRNIMTARIELAASKGCDALDPDNVDGYANTNGLGLTQQDSIDYIGFLSDTAALYNMTIGLKNAADIIDDVLNKTAFSVNEQCVQYSECSDFSPFIDANKPVFHIEYPKGTTTSTLVAVSINTVDTLCSTTGSASGSTDFSTVLKNINLNGWVQYCSGVTADTPSA